MDTLLNVTQCLLRSTTTPRRVIAKGASVDIEWLHKFAQGHIKEPGVNKVQRLHDYLSQQDSHTAA